MSSATEAMSLKGKATSGVAVQSAGAIAGSPLLRSHIDLSATLSVRPTPYFQKKKLQ